MSNLRHRFRVVLDGTELMITTSARDMAVVETDEEIPASDQTYRLLHAAAVRMGLDVPSDWEAFADLLDDVDDLEPESSTKDLVVNGKAPDPTHAAARVS